MNKEYGSDFYYIETQQQHHVSGESIFFKGNEQLFFSGRAALRAILENGIKEQAWSKIYVPSYYCYEVYRFIEDLVVEIEFYDCNPLQPSIPPSVIDEEGCALLIINYFGICTPCYNNFKRIATIEDVTHNLAVLHQSKADYVFGSLRKVLPVPVGGIVKSKNKLPLKESTVFAEETAHNKFSGMLLKKKYLEGKLKDKESFRKLFLDAEQSFESLETYSILPNSVGNYLSKLKVTSIIESKKRNSQLAKSLMRLGTVAQLLTSDADEEFALILKFNKVSDRQNLREYLIALNIYPIVLWPNQVEEKDKLVEGKLLFIHIDFRYSSEDIKYIVNKINQFYKDV